MDILFLLFLSFFGLTILFLIIHYAIRSGIDDSKEVKALRTELTEIKKQIKDLAK